MQRCEPMDKRFCFINAVLTANRIDRSAEIGNLCRCPLRPRLGQPRFIISSHRWGAHRSRTGCPKSRPVGTARHFGKNRLETIGHSNGNPVFEEVRRKDRELTIESW